MIKQDELAQYATLEFTVTDTKKKLKLAEAKLKDMEVRIMDGVLSKEPQQKGKYRAKLEEYLKRAVLSWKDELIKVKGRLYTEQLLNNAERPPGHRLVVTMNNDERGA